MVRTYYMIIKEDDHLVGVFDALGETLSLPHFDLKDPTDTKDIQFMTSYLYNIQVDLLLKLRTSIEGSIVMYLVMGGSTSSFASQCDYDSLSYISLNDYEKLLNLDDEARFVIENFNEYRALEVNDPISDYDTETDEYGSY